jgi:type I restriction enzyme M protein
VALDSVSASLSELEEEHGGEEGALAALDKINKGEVNKRLKELGVASGEWQVASEEDEAFVLNRWLALADKEADLKRQIREAEAALDRLAYDQYPQLSVAEIKTLVVDDKWLTAVAASVQGELERVSQTLTGRIRQLAERYATPLPQLTDEVAELSARVEEHLKQMGAVWN